MDKITLKNMQFYGYHGLLPEENKLGQPFHVDLELYVSLEKAGKTDEMEQSIDYSAAFNAVKQVVENNPKNLIEAVAQSIADRLFKDFSLLKACRIKVKKPNPPIEGHYDYVAVEIYRER